MFFFRRFLERDVGDTVRARRGRRLPVALSRDEVQRLRVKEIDFERNAILVTGRTGSGFKFFSEPMEGPDAQNQSVNREGHPFLSSPPYGREGIHDSPFTDRSRRIEQNQVWRAVDSEETN